MIFSPESYSQTFGLNAGLNLSNVVSKNDVSEYNLQTGFHAGVIADIPINRALAFETGLGVSTKGYRQSAKIQFLELHDNIRSYYLEVPLALKAFFEIPTMTFSFLAGPYLAIGFYGSDKGNSNSNGTISSWSEKINWEAQFKRLDYGLIVGPGIQVKHLLVNISYGWGLANISPFSSMKLHNRVAAFTVGYKFLEKEF